MYVKRLLMMAISATLLCTVPCAAAEEEDDLFYFGRYEQDGDFENGEEFIGWMPVDEDGDKLLLISYYVLDCMEFHIWDEDITWEDSSVREWLNTEFIDVAFTEEEQELLVPVKHSSPVENSEWESRQGGETEDIVFLLSYEELENYLNYYEFDGTDYVYNMISDGSHIFSDYYDYWLRTPGEKQNQAAYINEKGDLESKNVSRLLGIVPAVWIDYGKYTDALPYDQWCEAWELFDEEKYDEAEEIFLSLNNYEDSDFSAFFCQYNKALLLEENGDFEEALKFYDMNNDCGYDDVNESGRICRYNYAKACIESKDYVKAEEILSDLGTYQDSRELLMDCYEQLGTNLYYLSSEPVNAGKDTGYSKKDSIKNDDPHFGWTMGDFIISGYTRQQGDSDKPIFIKTAGDNITLWFSSKQNIEELNGNSKLLINYDTNGSDEYFGVSKREFGYGALIVRHTDANNRKSDPQVYADYLKATDTTGANTHIDISEEGTYEIALDYEIEDTDIKHKLNSIRNYRVFCTFTVVNGNSMVFPFDIKTGEELSNKSITQNGFRLDLARSRSLNIDVKHSILIENGTGIVEDVRFNKPAKDGTEYSDEGIYTITVSNPQTGETTEKILFVGDDDLLKKYISLGFDATVLEE